MTLSAGRGAVVLLAVMWDYNDNNNTAALEKKLLVSLYQQMIVFYKCALQGETNKRLTAPVHFLPHADVSSS